MSLFERTSRILYNQDFIDAGCPADDYDQDFELDDTVGMWSTNFSNAIVGVGAFVKLGSYGCAPLGKKINAFLPYFFLSMAISFFVAAIGHIVVRSRSDERAKVIFEGLAVAFFGVSTIFLVLYGLELFQITMFSPERWKKGIWWTTSVLLTAVVVYSTVEVSLAYISMLGMLVYLIITVLLLVARPKLWIAKALGTATLFASLVAQITFNHNGLFHVLYLVGIVILFRAENCNPSVMCGDGVILPMVENKIPGLRQSAL